jgi:hypothetical protein
MLIMQCISGLLLCLLCLLFPHSQVLNQLDMPMVKA